MSKKKSTSMVDTYVNIITSIVGVAASQTEGVASVTNEAGSPLSNIGALRRGSRSIKVDIINDSVTVEISINAYSTSNVPELVCRLQENVKREIEKSTSYRVKAINVHIVGVVFTA